MKKTKIIFLTLVITLILTFSTINLTAEEPISPDHGELTVEKMVTKNGCWKENIVVEQGDTIFFRINITYENTTDDGVAHWAHDIVINDTLPMEENTLCIEYAGMVIGPNPTITGEYNQYLTWDLDICENPDFKLMDGETYTLVFEAIVLNECDCCGEQVENLVTVNAKEHCTGHTFIDITDTAEVYIECPTPDINVDKKVWNYKTEQWVENGFGIPYEDSRFNITVENNGECTLDIVWVNDTLEEGFVYNNDATHTPYSIEDNRNITWKFTDVEVDEKIYIEFDATLMDNIPPNEYDNNVEVTGITDCSCCPSQVTDQDTSTVTVRGMRVEKEVSLKTDGEWGPWLEQVEAANGQKVRFRIQIYYYGYYTLYDIVVEDTLPPEGLTYDNNAYPEEPDIDGNVLTWELDEVLGNGESTSVRFQTIVNCDDCKILVNNVHVVAEECSGTTLDWDDEATVDVVCELNADAGGPYTGMVDEPVTITGDATNGIPPYTYEWDLDDDGEYDDDTGQSITYTWDEEGSYTIWLKVTDDVGNTDEDYASVEIILENEAPNRPSLNGPTNNLVPGQKYSYTVSATDPDDDQVYYYIDWGDGENTGWLGPYNSSTTITKKHSWDSSNTAYTVKAQAKDIHDATSPWKNLPIETPVEYNWLQQIIYNLLESFPLLKAIVTLLLN